METIRFTINVVPRSKKNSSRIINGRNGKAYLIPSAAYMDYEKAGIKFCPRLRISEPVNVEAHYYVPDRRKRDLCNFHEALCDLLVAAETVVDDSVAIIVSMDRSRIHYDKDNPRIEVIITEGEEYDKEFIKEL